MPEKSYLRVINISAEFVRDWLFEKYRHFTEKLYRIFDSK
jgi:hypothetical protein